MGFLIRVLMNALAIYFAAAIVPGIELSGVMAALGSGLVLGLVNAVVRPILILLTLPFTLLTLGLFLFVLNGLCLWLTSWLVKGFEVHSFLGGCLWGHTGECRELAADHECERQGSNCGDQALARSGTRFHAMILWELIGVPGA